MCETASFIKTLKLQSQHPTSFFVIIAKRTDAEDRNDWNNYTNWIDQNLPPYSDGFNNPFYEKYANDPLANERVSDIFFNTSIVTDDLFDKLRLKYENKKKPYVLNSISLKLNGTDRFDEQDSEFFNTVETSCFSKRIPRRGVLFYSFSLNPFEYQPSGTCNMSRFNSIELLVETVDTPIPTSLGENLYKFDINVYTVNYNILRIVSGMGNLEFAN